MSRVMSRVKMSMVKKASVTGKMGEHIKKYTQ
jgi:hypothetical protein